MIYIILNSLIYLLMVILYGVKDNPIESMQIDKVRQINSWINMIYYRQPKIHQMKT